MEKAPKFEFSDQVNNIKLLDALIALEIPEFNNIEENYPYWDKIKYIKEPNHYKIEQKDFAKKLWIALKTKRHLKNINKRLSTNSTIK